MIGGFEAELALIAGEGSIDVLVLLLPVSVELLLCQNTEPTVRASEFAAMLLRVRSQVLKLHLAFEAHFLDVLDDEVVFFGHVFSCSSSRDERFVAVEAWIAVAESFRYRDSSAFLHMIREAFSTMAKVHLAFRAMELLAVRVHLIDCVVFLL
jgi:hypothetical protein